MCDYCHRAAIVAYTGDDYDVGVCSTCADERGVAYNRAPRRYISPDDFERNREWYNEKESRDRARILDGRVGEL